MNWKTDPAARALFLSKIDKRGPDECWPWRGGTFKAGYGGFWDGSQMVGAHRVMLMMKLGRALQRGEQAQHSCDNRRCVNPAHLSAGSPAVNSGDMVSRGRQMHGEGHYIAKLNDQAVRIIHALIAGGQSNRAIGERFGVSRATISDIRTGKTWKHIEMSEAK